MANSKIIFGDEVLIDLTGDNIAPEYVLKGHSGHGPDGEPFEGTCDYDVNSSGATAKASEILLGKTAAVGGKMLTGEMPNNGAVAGKITTKAGKYIVPRGFHDGSGYAEIDSTEQGKLISENIRQGVSILGVEGTMSGSEDVKAQSKNAVPKIAAQTILPDSGFTHLTQVVIAAIPVTRTENARGGTTVTIG